MIVNSTFNYYIYILITHFYIVKIVSFNSMVTRERSVH